MLQPFLLRKGEKLKRHLSDHSALIASGDGRTALVQSTTPMRVGGDGEPFSLSLVQDSDDLVPENSVSTVRIGNRADRGVTLASGVRFAPSSAPRSAAHVVEDRAFFANVGKDVDYVVEPLAGGAEALFHLRSAESTEAPALTFELPGGARLVRSESVAGGVEIVRGDRTLASVAPPAAWDADGYELPVRYEVVGDRLITRVQHRDRDVRYPLLVDPAVIDNRMYWNRCGNSPCFTFDGWQTNQSGGFLARAGGDPWWWKGQSLYQIAYANTSYPAGAWVNWFYQARRQSHIVRTDFYTSHSPSRSQFVKGLWSSYRWEGEWHDPGYGPNPAPNSYGGHIEGDYDTHCADPYGTCNYAYGSTGNFAIGQLLLPGGGSSGAQATGAIEGAAVYLWDHNDPTIHRVGDNVPGWTQDTSFRISVDARDAGLGVKRVRLAGPGLWDERSHGCTGQLGNGRECPDFWGTHHFDLHTSRWGDGVHTLEASTVDIIDRSGPGSHTNYTVRVDRSDPSAVELSGALWERRDRGVGSSMKLRAIGRDQWSGVRRLELFVDGQPVDASMPGSQVLTQGDPGTGGSMDRELDFDPGSLREGPRRVKVVATDGVNRTAASTEFTVVVDRTKPLITRAYGPARAVAVNGGVHQLTSRAEDAPAAMSAGVEALEVFVDDRTQQRWTQACTTRGCPLERTFDFDTRQETADAGRGYAEGRRRFSVDSADGAGNPAAPLRFDVIVDRSDPVQTPTGTLVTADGTETSQAELSLRVDSVDGTPPPSSPSDADRNSERSGVQSIEVVVDDERADYVEQTCPEGSCPLSRSWTFRSGDYEGGWHTIEVITTDQVGHSDIDVYRVKTACCLQAKQASPMPDVLAVARLGDVTGDGAADVVTHSAITGALRVSPANGDGTYRTPEAWGQFTPGPGDLAVADADADGLADVVFRPDPASRVYVARSTGSGFATATDWGEWDATLELHVADIDGDAAADLVGRPKNATLHGTEVKGAYSEISSFEPPLSFYTGPHAGADHRIDFADVDGDTVADLILTPREGAGGPKVATGADGTFGVPVAWNGPPSVAGRDIAYGDVDADGMADAVARDHVSGDVTEYLSDGSAFGAGDAAGKFDATLQLARADHDDRRDLVGVENGFVHVALSNNPQPTVPAADVPEDADDVEDATDLWSTAEPGTVTAASHLRRPQMPLFSQDDAVLLDRRQLLENDPEGSRAWDRDRSDPNTPSGYEQANAKLDAIYTRLKAAGVSGVRFNVYWGFAENAPGKPTPYYWDTPGNALDESIDMARRHGMIVYLTLTGVTRRNYECRLAGHRLNPDARSCDAQYDESGKWSQSGTAYNDQLARWKQFVGAAVQHFTPRGVSHYGIWNEPNLNAGNPNSPTRPGPTFLQWGGPNNHTFALYREIYREAYAAAKAASTRAKVMIGELSSRTVNAREQFIRGSRRVPLTPIGWLERAVSTSGGLQTDGVALHPYDHIGDPWAAVRGASDYTAGIRRLKLPKGNGDCTAQASGANPLKLRPKGVTSHLMCLARRGLLFPSGQSTRPDTDKTRPQLLLTEFGYLNQPRRGQRVESYHTELRRAKYIQGHVVRRNGQRVPQLGAFDMARKAPAKMMLWYQLHEDWPGDPRDPSNLNHDDIQKGVHDSGLMSVVPEDPDRPRRRSDPNDPTSPLVLEDPLAVYVTGSRDYNKFRNAPTRSDAMRGHPTPRYAYCALERWAAAREYETLQPAATGNYCSGPAYTPNPYTVPPAPTLR